MNDTFVPAAGHAALTGLYDRVIAISAREKRVRRPMVAAIAASLDGIAVPRVLELGSGTGSLTAAVARAVPRARITGIDIDPETIAIATRKCAGMNV